jgi:4a-hydroxytetrahydrobiopterin dehydratase
MKEHKVTLATTAQIKRLHRKIPDWKIESAALSRQFDFENFYETVAFVNAIAWIANQADHHPDLAVSYNKCVVSFSTHSVGGLSEKDFECAQQVDGLLGQ